MSDDENVSETMVIMVVDVRPKNAFVRPCLMSKRLPCLLILPLNYTLQRAVEERSGNHCSVCHGPDWATPLSNRSLRLLTTVIVNAPTTLLYPTIYPFFNTHADGR